MFNEHEKQMLIDALDMAQKSNKRAMNTRTNPEFITIYKKVESDLRELMTKVTNIKQVK